MSRHRNVRSMNYEDEYYDEDDVYGHSVEDGYCISPGTAAQFTFNRDHNVALSSFMDEEGGIPEEDELDEGTPREAHRSSLDYTRPQLNDIDEAKLNSVLEEVRNVLGDSVPEHVMVDTIMRHNFSVEGSLNEMLEAPKPQREPRRDRRNRSQEFDVENDGRCSVSPSPNSVFSCNPVSAGGLMKFGDKLSPNLLCNKKKIDLKNSQIIVKQQCAVMPFSKVGVVKATIGHNIHKQLHNTTQDLVADSNHLEIFDEATKNSSLSELAKSNQSVGVKLSDLAISNQSNGVKLSDLSESNRNSGLKLSDLAKSTQSGGLKLSDLAKLNQNNGIKLLDLAKSNQSGGVNLSELAKSNQSGGLNLSELAKSNRSGGVNLSELAKSNQSGGLKLSELANADQNMGSKTDLCKDQNPNKNGISVALSELAKTHIAQSPENIESAKAGGSPLSSLAKTHLGSSPVSSLAANNLPRSSHLSVSPSRLSSPLSQLTKQDAPNTQTQPAAMKPGVSLAQLAVAHGVKTSQPRSLSSVKDNPGNIDQGTDISGSLLSSDLVKSKTDTNQIMSSLSSLIADRKPIRVNQQCAISECIPNIDKAVHASTLEPSNSPSLVDLLKKPGLQTKKKQLGELHSKQEKLNKNSKPSDGSDTLQTPDLKNMDDDIENIDTQSLSENLVFVDDVPIESLKYLMNKSSILGHSLCLASAAKSRKSCKKRYRWKRFEYKCQMNGMVLQPCKELNKIIPYDFSDPSPDDIVKTKQKLAFKRP